MAKRRKAKRNVKRSVKRKTRRSTTSQEPWFYHSQLLTVLIVAIAAIIVMIGLFWVQTNSGAATFTHGANTARENRWVGIGLQTAASYKLNPYMDRIEHCSRACGTTCSAQQERPVGDCYDWCKTACEFETSGFTAASTEAQKVMAFGPQYS